MIKSFQKYDKKNTHKICVSDLFDWIDERNSEFPCELVEELCDGADIDRDGFVNYVAYTQLVCRNILHLQSSPLKVQCHSRDLSGT